MRCPLCHHADTQVVETRVSETNNVVRRRRRCPKCDQRFTTYEHAEINMPMVVKKMEAVLSLILKNYVLPCHWPYVNAQSVQKRLISLSSILKERC